MRTSFEGIRVLLFSAEKDSIDPLKKPLIRHGLLVSTVQSPKQVLKVVKNIRMDLLIVDDDSGNWAAQILTGVRFLSSPSGSHIPAILLSKQQVADARALLKFGFQEHLEKPVSLEQLLLAIDRVVPEPDPSTGRVLFRS
jgi:DNA-binding response OmpR family regulator